MDTNISSSADRQLGSVSWNNQYNAGKVDKAAEQQQAVSQQVESKAKGQNKEYEGSQQSISQIAAETKNLSLRFKVDPDTREINVMMIDKESGQVVRTIPPEELANFTEGKLLELFL